MKSYDARFPSPWNFYFWIPLALALVAGFREWRNGHALALVVALAVGAVVAFFGHRHGTTKVRAYRLWRIYLSNSDFNTEENFHLLEEAYALYPHPAISVPFVRLLAARGMYWEACARFDRFAWDALPEFDRRNLQVLHARIVWSVGQGARASEMIEKLLSEMPSYSPALNLLEEMQREHLRKRA